MSARVLSVLMLVTMAFHCAAETTSALSTSGILNYVLPNFPPGLRGIMAGDGEVVVAVNIDSEGKVVDSVALLSTNESFADVTLRAVSQWVFIPRESETWPRREVLEFEFKRSGVVTSLSHAEAAREGFISTAYLQTRTVQWDELETKPQRIGGRMPTVSKSALNAHGKKAIVVNFVIDKEGQVRVPVAYGVSDLQLADAVLDAVSSWRYSPPLIENKSVLIEVTRVFMLDDSES